MHIDRRDSMAFNRGDKVREEGDARVMEVLASSDNLTLCSFDEGGFTRQSVFETRKLLKISVQQQQQPQQQSPEPPQDNAE
jgi:hypothetical protein